jgi:hypothetical protein
MDESDSVRVINACLRYYLHIPDPDSLSDEEWAMRYRELEWIRKKEGKKS